jgi:dTDP-4-amino-4,6-dideoxygalactose transaminase
MTKKPSVWEKTKQSDRILKDVLASAFGKKYFILTSRGTTAIYSALRAQTKPGDEVILPAMVCPDVLYAIFYARLKPILCDIRADDYTIDLASMRQHSSERTRAIIAIHLFGQPCRIDEICEFARQRNIAVLEDVAQSVGTVYKGKPTGTLGDITILSFGETKIINGGGGGAILTDDAHVTKRISLHSCFPEKSKDYDSIYETYKKIYYSAIELEQFSPEGAHKLLKEFPSVFKDLYFFQTPSLDINRIVDGFNNLQEMKRIRRENTKKYRELLNHPAIYHPPVSSSVNIYRYSVLIEKRALRDKVVYGLRAKGFNVSTLYPSLHSYLYATRPEELRTAIDIGERIINLWIEPGLPSGYIESSSELILKILKDNC